MDRKKRLRVFQLIFILIGVCIVIFTFTNKKNFNQTKIIPENIKKFEAGLKKNKEAGGNIFYNVKYSGLDLQGNRYIIIAKEAINSDTNPNLVEMKKVEATFYFKDNTQLLISSNKGEYNNKTLDIKFENNVEALYMGSELYAEKAVFSNSNNTLMVSNNVKVKDTKGTMLADKLMFDIKEKTLKITSLKDKMVRSKINYK